MPFCSEPADVSALSCSVPKNKKRRQLAAGPQPAKISGKAEVTSGKHYDVIDVHSTRMRLFSYDQLTNTGGGTFFTVGGAWESAGKGKVGIPPWKLEYEPTMSRKSELNSLIPILVELILATAVHFPVWHSHCTGAKFTVLVSCRDELLTVHSCPLLWLQSAEAGCETGEGIFYYWPLLRNNNMATNLQTFTSSCGNRYFAACDC